MITYNKERGAWNFKDATQDEKDVLMEMAEQVWANAMAMAIAKQMMQQAQELEEENGPGDPVFFQGDGEPPEREEDTNVYGNVYPLGPAKPGTHGAN